MESILERIEQRLTGIEQRLTDVEKGINVVENDCHKMSNHINFVESVYNSMYVALNYINSSIMLPFKNKVTLKPIKNNNDNV